MKIVLKTLDEGEYEVENITSLVLTQTAGVACDSISMSFISKAPVGEVVRVFAYLNGELIFNGYCDSQRISSSRGTYENYIYARSSACLLVDNEAQPCTYYCPSAKQLCLNYSDSLGFTCALPELTCEQTYQVAKGTSSYGAINDFVSMLTGSPIYATPKNELRLFEKSSDKKSLNSFDILSLTQVINRSEPLFQINYKKDSSSQYKLHTKSRLALQKQLSAQRYLNLTNISDWQRDYTVSKKLRDSFEDYNVLEVTVKGFVDEPLYTQFYYSDGAFELDGYVLTEKKYVKNSAEQTRLTLKRAVDIEEVTYVD